MPARTRAGSTAHVPRTAPATTATRERRPTGKGRPRRDAHHGDAHHERPHNGGAPGSHHTHHYCSKHDESHNHTTPGSPTVVGVARKTTSSSTHLSTGALALAILGALLALGCAVWVVGRWLALEPRWTVSVMHSLREATYPRLSHLGGVFRLGQSSGR